MTPRPLNPTRLFATLILLPLLSGSVATAATAFPRTAATAWRLVSGIRGEFNAPPRPIPTGALPGGPLLGNGDLGVSLGGPPDQLRFYIDKSDFFGVIRGYMLPMGSLRLHIPALRHASYHATQNIGPAIVAAHFAARNGAAMNMQSWTAATDDILVIQLHNTGTKSLAISSRLLDAWSTPGSFPVVGKRHHAAWLNVSPDTVNLILGNQIKQSPQLPFTGDIADIVLLPIANPSQAALTAPTWPNPKDVQSFRGAVIKPGGKHGWSVHLLGRKHSFASLGMMRLPQRQFTLSLWLHTTDSHQTAVLFAAQPSNFWRFGPQNYAGFSMGLRDGRLTAKLNRTMVTAKNPLPVGHWVHVKAVYDAHSLRLYSNSARVAQSTAFPTAAQVMGADKYSIHTGDKAIPFADCAPKGRLTLRVLGTLPRFSAGRVRFILQPGQRVTLLTTAQDNRPMPTGTDAQTAYPHFPPALTFAAVARLKTDHLAWWKHFWGKSFINIPDKQVRNAWYGSLYILACCSAPGHDAPGLWGNFVTTTHPGWQGDYTLDYNYEAPFWAAYPTNHISLAENYDSVLLHYMPRGAAEAKAAGFHGLYDYTHLIPLPGWDADPSRHMAQKSGILFGTVDCIMRWRYTHDPAYARKIYPLLLATAAFWDHYLQLRNGMYVDANDAPGENRDAHAVNPATSIAFLRLLYGGLISISRDLHKNPSHRQRWIHILDHLSPLPIVPAASIKPIADALGSANLSGKWVIRQAQIGPDWVLLHDRFSPHYKPRQESSSPGMSASMAIFPGWQIGLESTAQDRNAARNTIRYQRLWFDFNNTCSFYPAAACAGYNPVSILNHMHILTHHFMRPNFAFWFGGGGVENCADIPAGVCAMFLQSYQSNIHIFPDWPGNQNASFGDLLACGNFLVSSRLQLGRIQYVRIISNSGGPLRLANPWPGHRVHVSVSGGRIETLHQSVLKLSTTPGESITFTP